MPTKPSHPVNRELIRTGYERVRPGGEYEGPDDSWQALSPRLLRLVVGLVALWSGFSGFALWFNYSSGSDLLDLAIAAIALIAPGYALVMLWGHRADSTMHESESKACLLLAVNTIVPIVLHVVVAMSGIGEAGYQLWNQPELTLFALFLFSGGSVVNQIIPPLCLRAAIERRLREPLDQDWTPHDSSVSSRTTAVYLLCILIGGWAAAIGISFAGVVALIGFSQTIDAQLMLTPMVAFPFGAFLGLICGMVVAPLLRNTLLERSLPITLWTTIGTGALATSPTLISGVAGPGLLGAIGLTGAAGIISAAISRKRFHLFPEGDCQKCGYSLAGITDPRCPECGHLDQRPPTPSPARAVEPVTSDDATPADR